MARYAEAAGAHAESLRWLSRAAEATEDVPGSYLQAGVGMEMIPMLVAANRYEDAVQAGVQGGRATTVLSEGWPDWPTGRVPGATLPVCLFAYALAGGLVEVGIASAGDRSDALRTDRRPLCPGRSGAVGGSGRAHASPGAAPRARRWPAGTLACAPGSPPGRTGPPTG